MGCSLKCNKCGFVIRVFSAEELDFHQKEHNKTCDGKFESLWKDWKKMSEEEREKLMNKVMFRSGKLGYLDELDEDVKGRVEKLLPKEKYGVGG